MGRGFKDQIDPFLSVFTLYNDQHVEKKMTMLDGYEVKALQTFSLLSYATDDKRLTLTSPDIYRKGLTGHGFHSYQNLSRYTSIDPLPSILFYPGICEQDTAPPKENAHWESTKRPKFDPSTP
ncbi:hypothetical protein BDN70DRAFT_995465 [Pholiota conissans]|uniref:Uncharacterized protein n=1 Tax=Pholiota conissans TaxID=109636 RepID=A0A9P6CXX9_9AGAR|nr:hypothetical protein BDN70DRAFT_995465 [Pholiota conissans]